MLAENELFLITWYSTLNELERLIVRAWITTNDIRLMFWFGLLPRYLDEICEIVIPEGDNQLPFFG